MKSTAALALALGLASFTLPNTGYAIGLEQKGQPTTVNALPTYGMEVPTRTALKTVIPSGWQLFVHHSAKLPKAVSWQPGDPWPHVLASMAIQANLAVLLDWDARTVLVRTEDVAVQEKATRAEIAQAATTPLPKFEVVQARQSSEALVAEPVVAAKPFVPPSPLNADPVPLLVAQPAREPAPDAAPPPAPPRAAATPLAAAPSLSAFELVRAGPLVPEPVTEQTAGAAAGRTELRASAASPQPVAPARPAPVQPAVAVRTPVIRTNPTPSMVAAQEAAAAKKPAALVSTDKFSYVAPTAVNKASVRSVAQGIATRYGLRLVWAAPEVALRGPVTMLSNNAAEDLYLLKKALGPSELEFQLSETDKSLQVSRKGGLQRRRPTAPYAPVSVAAAKIERVAVTAAQDVPAHADERVAAQSTTLAPLPIAAPVATPAEPPLFSFSVAQGEPLENALLRFLRAQGYTYEWKVAGGFEAARLMTFEGTSLVEVLSQVLPPLGVSADVYTKDKHIVVRPGDALDK